MARLQGIPAADVRRFRTGRPCLDCAHTGGDGPLAVFELLHDEHDVARWLAVVLDVDAVVPDGRTRDEAVAVRRAIWSAAGDLVAGRPVAAADRAAINAAAAWPPPVPVLAAGGAAAVAGPVTTTQALSALARDAVDLFGGPLAGRIRVCAADDCGLLFVDQSRPGARRWCSMQRCGNLAKVRRHRSPEP
jgi:predicted RNA-binding Zn ribbon-like protein